MTIKPPTKGTPTLHTPGLAPKGGEADSVYERDLRVLAELLLEIYMDRHTRKSTRTQTNNIDDGPR